MADVDWAGFLEEEDAEGLWNALFKLVSRHPSVRPLRFATNEAAVSSDMEINADLTQELFLELWQKQRFDYWSEAGYTSAQIETELSRFELPNLVGARLRQRYPESFRMARRISTILKRSPKFRRFDGPGGSVIPGRRGRPSKAESNRAPQRKMVYQVYGLKKWPAKKPTRDSGSFGESIKQVPARIRDTRVVGRAGVSQLILSNRALEELIEEIFAAIDSPAEIKAIRRLAMTKVPLQDYTVSSLDSGRQAGTGKEDQARAPAPTPRDCRRNSEEELLLEQRRKDVAGMAEGFLTRLRHAVNNNPHRYIRLIQTLWHCYYDPKSPSQLEMARILGVSDSLVSDNRKIIEYELRGLKLTVEDGTVFSESLKRLVVQEGAVQPRGAASIV